MTKTSVKTQKPKIIVVGGATSTGKSSLAVKIAKEFNGEVVSADSMQIYKGMNIGTGKITLNEMQGITHHMIDIVPPDKTYTVSDYKHDATLAIESILKNGKLPIITGGTGLYINALLNNYSFSKTGKNELLRENMQQLANQQGAEVLYRQLKEVDPIAAETIMPNDVKRIIRALEIFNLTGKPKSESVDTPVSNYDYLFFVMDFDREVLYKNINDRVDNMIKYGLIKEVRNIGLSNEFPSMNAIGYKETLDYLDSNQTDTDIFTLKENIKKNTRHYAKRQITYFKNVFKNTITVDLNDCENIYKLVSAFL